MNDRLEMLQTKSCELEGRGPEKQCRMLAIAYCLAVLPCTEAVAKDVSPSPQGSNHSAINSDLDKLTAKQYSFVVEGATLHLPEDYVMDPSTPSLIFLWLQGKPLSKKQSNYSLYSSRDEQIQALVQIFLRPRKLLSPGAAKTSREKYEDSVEAGVLGKKVQFESGLYRQDVLDPSTRKIIGAYCIANDSLSFDGKPAVLECFSPTQPATMGRVTSRFVWRENIIVNVWIYPVHTIDWPRINAELVQVLNLVKETQQ